MNGAIRINDSDVPRTIEIADAAAARRNGLPIESAAWQIVIGRCISLMLSGASFAPSPYQRDRFLGDYIGKQGYDILSALGFPHEEIVMLVSEAAAEAQPAVLRDLGGAGL